MKNKKTKKKNEKTIFHLCAIKEIFQNHQTKSITIFLINDKKNTKHNVG